jgi:hypothetical protein
MGLAWIRVHGGRIMKRTLLALSCLVLLLAALIAGASLGVAQTSQPVKDARPTPTPELPLPAAPPSVPESPESPEIPPLPDLIVEKIEVDPPNPRIYETVTIRVTIKNQGSLDVVPGNNFWSDLYIDPAVVPIQLGQDGQAEWPCQATWVRKDTSYTLETEYVFDDVKVFVLYAQVDTDGHVGEANENNNVLGPVHVQVDASHKLVHQTHQDFQMGLASTLDVSHPEGVIRRGIFWEPFTEPDVYDPDTQIDKPPLPPSHPNNVNQIHPALASDGTGRLFAVWEDGRNGGVFNRDIYFSRSNDNGNTWGPDIRVNNDPPLPNTANQVKPDLVYDPSRDRLYVAWQDWRNGNYDIYFTYYDVGTGTWSANQKKLNDDVGSASQLNPSIAVGPATVSSQPDRIYVVWQDQRNGNDDVYLARSNDGGLNWSQNYFVTDDPHMREAMQTAPSVSVENLMGWVVVGWEDWRDQVHPEVYAMWSKDEGETYGIDVPVTIVPPESRTTYRIEPTVAAQTTIERVEYWDPVNEVWTWKVTPVTVIHAAWQQGQDEYADVYYASASWVHDWEARKACPWPYGMQDFCFDGPQLVSGYAINSDYVRPPETGETWSLEPSWQGQVTLDIVPDDMYWTGCHFASTQVYSRGVIIAWSDARSYDEWRYEIRTRRAASPEGDPETFEVCEDWAAGMVNSNAKLFAYRDDLDQYTTFRPAATGQFNADIVVDAFGIYAIWDDDRHDVPLEPSTVRDRDVFFARMGAPLQGIYISPVIDSRTADPAWYVLSWWGATQHLGDLLFQTRFGNTGDPPHDDIAANTWTRWTGNPSSTYLGCVAGVGCYYDAPGRHIVDPSGREWFDCPGPQCPAPYRYMQYKVAIGGAGRLTAVSQVTIHYKGPYEVYLPAILRAH